MADTAPVPAPDQDAPDSTAVPGPDVVARTDEVFSELADAVAANLLGSTMSPAERDASQSIRAYLDEPSPLSMSTRLLQLLATGTVRVADNYRALAPEHAQGDAYALEPSRRGEDAPPPHAVMAARLVEEVLNHPRDEVAARIYALAADVAPARIIATLVELAGTYGIQRHYQHPAA